MKYYVAILLGLILTQSQAQNLDSLYQTINETTEKAKIQKLTDMSFDEAFNNPSYALLLAQYAYDKADQIEFPEGKASALHKMAVTFRLQGYYDKALTYGDSALQIAIPADLISIQAAIYSNQGVSHRYKGEYDQALESYQKSIELHRELDEPEQVGTVLNNIGVMFMYLEDYEKAISYYDQALEIQLEENNKKEQANIYNNFAIVYANQGLLDSSLTYFERSYEIEKELDNLKGMSESINNIGAVYYYLGDFNAAIDAFYKSYAIDSTMGDVRGMITCMTNIAELHNESGNAKAAISILEENLQKAREIDSKTDVETAYLNLTQSYQILGDFEKALDNYIKYAAVHDTVLGQQQMDVIAEMETKYQTKEKEQELVIKDLELKEQEEEIRARNQMVIGLIVLTILLVLGAYFGYRSYKSKNELKMERTLRLEEEKRLDAVIDATESERTRISKELHDGIGQQLTSIKLGLVKENAGSQENINTISSIADEAADSARSLSHQMMPKALKEVGLQAALVDMFNKSFGVKDIQHDFTWNFDESKLDEKSKLDLYRIAQEWTNNLLKYSSASQAEIQLYAVKSQLIFMLSENGEGFDPSKRTGHGITNMETRARRMNGQLSFEKSNSPQEFITTVKIPVA